MDAKIISIKGRLEIAKARRDQEGYRQSVAVMDKLELLEEMVKFQEDLGVPTDAIAVDALVGAPLDNIIRGLIVFQRLKECCETEELKDLVVFYTGILELELAAYGQRSDDNRLCPPAQGGNPS